MEIDARPMCICGLHGAECPRHPSESPDAEIMKTELEQQIKDRINELNDEQVRIYSKAWNDGYAAALGAIRAAVVVYGDKPLKSSSVLELLGVLEKLNKEQS